jgi:1-acyl-sn-glycerol-3-phosphate acyltransferase
MLIRTVGRACWFLFEVVVISTCYFLTAARAPKEKQRHARATWLSWSSRRHLKIFNYTADVAGEIPTHGLLICNHLSYLDVLSISAVTPAVFVSKADVRHWPLFGWFAAIAGTVFVDRQRRQQVGQVNQEIGAALAAGELVVIFPEGTSTNGDTILPFRTPLLEPAARGHYDISVGWLHYELEDGDARQEVCYWGDHAFFSHVVHMLGKRKIRATLRFGKFQPTTDDRKVLAAQLHEAVLKLKTEAENVTKSPAR